MVSRMAIERDHKGRIKKGSKLNPGGMTGEVSAERARLRAAALELGDEPLEALLDIARSSEDEAVRLRAWTLIYSYQVGKPVQLSEAEVAVKQEINVDQRIVAITARADDLERQVNERDATIKMLDRQLRQEKLNQLKAEFHPEMVEHQSNDEAKAAYAEKQRASG